MKIGICTTDFEREAASSLLKTIADMGFGCVQLSFASITECRFAENGQFEIPFSVTDSALDAIQSALEENGLALDAVNGTFNMAHPDPDIRKEGIERFDGFCDAVASLRCPIVSICTGTRNPAHLWRPSDQNDTPKAWDDMETTVAACADIARKYGLRLGIETEASNVVNTPEKAIGLIREIGSDALGIIFDGANLFHANMAYPKNVRPVLGHAFDLLGENLLLAHGKDIAEGPGIEFCPTGTGILDFPYFLERLRACGYEGDMLLHGIYRLPAMREGLAKMREWIGE